MHSGVIGSMCIGRIGASSHPDIGEIKLHINGTKGALVISEARPEISIYYQDQPKYEFKNERIANENDFHLLENFISAIEKNTDIILDEISGFHISKVVDACINSNKHNKVIKIK